MRKFVLPVIILIFTCFIATSAIAKPQSFSKDEKMFFSKLDKEYLDVLDDEEDEGWVILIKQFGENKIETAFPSNPEFFYEKKLKKEVFRFLSQEEEASYTFVIEKGIEWPNDYKFRKENKDLYLERSGAYGPIFDREFQQNGKVIKKRVQFAEDLLCTFTTEKRGGAPDLHDEFVSSFSIIKPLV